MDNKDTVIQNKNLEISTLNEKIKSLTSELEQEIETSKTHLENFNQTTMKLEHTQAELKDLQEEFMKKEQDLEKLITALTGKNKQNESLIVAQNQSKINTAKLKQSLKKAEQEIKNNRADIRDKTRLITTLEEEKKLLTKERDYHFKKHKQYELLNGKNSQRSRESNSPSKTL